MSMDYEAWRCTTRDRFPDGPSVFCPEEGCSKRDGCARDKGWTPTRRKRVDIDATYKLMVDPASDLDEAAVAATDLLHWLADGRYSPWPPLRQHEIVDEAKYYIFRALDRLAELEGP